MTVIPTIKVVSKSAPGGFVIINKSDLTAKHELWEEPLPPGDDTLKTAPATGVPRTKVETDAAGNVERPVFNLNSSKKNK